jgi:hypothetical protein
MYPPPALSTALRRAPAFARGSALHCFGQDCADRRCSDLSDLLTAPLCSIPRGQLTANTIGHHPVGKGVLGLLLSHVESPQLGELTAHAAAVGFREHRPPMGVPLDVSIIIRQNGFGSLYLTEPQSAGAIADARLFDQVRSTTRWTKATS